MNQKAIYISVLWKLADGEEYILFINQEEIARNRSLVSILDFVHGVTDVFRNRQVDYTFSVDSQIRQHPPEDIDQNTNYQKGVAHAEAISRQYYLA